MPDLAEYLYAAAVAGIPIFFTYPGLGCSEDFSDHLRANDGFVHYARNRVFKILRRTCPHCFDARYLHDCSFCMRSRTNLFLSLLFCKLEKRLMGIAEMGASATDLQALDRSAAAALGAGFSCAPVGIVLMLKAAPLAVDIPVI
jgi:hypothetical protein